MRAKKEAVDGSYWRSSSQGEWGREYEVNFLSCWVQVTVVLFIILFIPSHFLILSHHHHHHPHHFSSSNKL